MGGCDGAGGCMLDVGVYWMTADGRSGINDQ